MNVRDRKRPLRPFLTIILAAGKGKRMKDPEMSKVLNEIDGKPMIDCVVGLALQLHPQKTIVVVGHQHDAVVQHLSQEFGNRVTFIEQEEQLGTGHAVLQAERELESFQGDVLVLSGDVPLLTEETVVKLLAKHQESDAVATILTAMVENPSGYGRILRQADASVEKIVEDRDATEHEKRVKEINSGIYVFRKVELLAALRKLQPNNVQKEYYLTGIFELLRKENLPVLAVKALDFNEVRGVNTSEELREAEELFSEGRVKERGP